MVDEHFSLPSTNEGVRSPWKDGPGIRRTRQTLTRQYRPRNFRALPQFPIRAGFRLWLCPLPRPSLTARGRCRPGMIVRRHCPKLPRHITGNLFARPGPPTPTHQIACHWRNVGGEGGSCKAGARDGIHRRIHPGESKCGKNATLVPYFGSRPRTTRPCLWISRKSAD